MTGARAGYLRAPARRTALPGALLLATLYAVLTRPRPHATLLVLALGAAGAALAARGPRALAYALLLIALAVHVHGATQIEARGPDDAQSTRDDAVEQGARALLAGGNPWQVDPGAPPTTGPTSLLLALPVVVLFGDVNWLATVFWLAFFGVLLCADLRHENDTWPVLTLLFLLGPLGFAHTLRWSLEELYWGSLLLVLAHAACVRGRPALAGALLAGTVLSRLSYLWPMLGFLAWYAGRADAGHRVAARLAVGFLAGSAVVMAPIALLAGGDVGRHSFLTEALRLGGYPWPDTAWPYTWLNRLHAALGAPVMRVARAALGVAGVAAASAALRVWRPAHPYWHVTAGAFIAHGLVWAPGVNLAQDYALFFVLPAFLAMAETPSAA